MTIKSATERHIQTVAVFIITGVLAWVGLSLNSLIEHQARVDERIGYMTSQIIHLQEQLSNQISRRELDAELGQIHREMQRLDSRVEQLERQARD